MTLFKRYVRKTRRVDLEGETRNCEQSTIVGVLRLEGLFELCFLNLIHPVLHHPTTVILIFTNLVDELIKFQYL